MSRGKPNDSKRNTGNSKYKGDGKGASRYLSPKAKSAPRKRRSSADKLPTFDNKIRLNKFIANAGLCSRREADVFIETGLVTVNGKLVTELGYRVNPTDTVRFDGVTIKSEKKQYVLFNKPEGYTLRYEEDPSKKSVYSLIKNATKEQVFPIGRMDRAACGLVLFTNDGDMETKLNHPKYKVSQLFHVVLDKDMEEEDLEKLTKGLYVDDKLFNATEASYVKGKGRNEIGVQIHSPKSNVVKLMMGRLNYKILKIDRVEFAGLTKLDLPRGNYRHLTEKEVGFLKMN